MTAHPAAWTEPTNPHTTRHLRKIRAMLGTLRGDLQTVFRDAEPTDAQRQAIEEAWRLLGQARDVLAPATVDRLTTTTEIEGEPMSDPTDAMGYDGRTITVGAIVQRRTGGPVWLVDAIDLVDGRALMRMVAPHDRTVHATFHADCAVLVRAAKEATR